MTSIQPKERGFSRTWHVASGHTLESYRKYDGYAELAKASELTPDHLIQEVIASNVRGQLRRSAERLAAGSVGLPDGWQLARSSCRMVGSRLGRAAGRLAADSVELPDGWQAARSSCRMVGRQLGRGAGWLAASSAEVPDGW